MKNSSNKHITPGRHSRYSSTGLNPNTNQIGPQTSRFPPIIATPKKRSRQETPLVNTALNNTFQTPVVNKKKFHIRDTPLRVPESATLTRNSLVRSQNNNKNSDSFFLTHSDGKRDIYKTSHHISRSAPRLQPLPRSELIRDPDTGEFSVRKLPEKELVTEDDEIIRDKIDKTMDITRTDEIEQDIVGEEAIKNFQYHYKNIDKILNENKIYNIKNSLTTQILQQIKEDNLLPRKIGVFKSFGDKSNINLKYISS
jgi:hypothetical protein